jgi:hypothetical protein
MDMVIVLLLLAVIILSNFNEYINYKSNKNKKDGTKN